ncbi:hypothetical protein [Stenotrophomonas sp. PS02298]|uniref:hypothetical protein n=1 Tax=Stenotrophomonas sp. PS02298 TaxID=2991424 RepID=UPI00249B118A|nr:hypothetical protein [Stenotrophomonas sp. PS02298]
MSTSALCAVFKTKAVPVAEYRNGYGTGPVIWTYLSDRYLGGRNWGSAGGELWALAKDESIPFSLRAAHAMTFDQALVRPTDCLSFACLIEEAAAILEQWNPEYVNHFGAIASDLKGIQLDHRALGMGLCCSSVADVWRSWQGIKTGRRPVDCLAYITGREYGVSHG